MPNLYLALKSFFNLKLSYDQAFAKTNLRLPQKLIVVARIYLFYLFWMSFILVLITIISSLANLNYQDSNLEIFLKDKNIYRLLFFVVIIAPISEELLYRFWIKLKIKYLYLLAQLILIGYCFYQYFWSMTSWSPGLLVVPIIIEIILSTWFIFQKKIIGLFQNNYIFVVVFSALLFALQHFSNYSNLNLPNWYLAILVLPQFSLGLLLAFIRARLGISYAIILHALNNLFFIMPTVINDMRYLAIIFIFLVLIIINFRFFIREIPRNRKS